VRVLEKCISVLGMRFRSGRCEKGGKGLGVFRLIIARITLAIPLCLTMSFGVPNGFCYELLDRIVAVVNREVILYSELQGAVEKAKAAGEEKSEREILEELINRTLLLEQARKFRFEIETYSQDEAEARKMIDDYINRRIKSFIHVPFEEIESYYMSHKDDFGGRDMYQVWDEIEDRLRIEQLKIKIDEHITLLRKEADIRIQLDTG
jgi:hypothetical protein